MILPKLINITVLGVGRNTINLHVLYLAVPGLAGREVGKCFSSRTTYPHSAVHAAVPIAAFCPQYVPSRRRLFPSLVRPLLRDLLRLLVPHHLHHVGRLRLARLLSLRNPGQ